MNRNAEVPEMANNAVGCDRLPKASQLIDQINMMRELENRLEEICQRIGGAPVPSNVEKATDHGDSLAAVLDHGPDSLSNTRNNCHDVITRIEDLLF